MDRSQPDASRPVPPDVSNPSHPSANERPDPSSRAASEPGGATGEGGPATPSPGDFIRAIVEEDLRTGKNGTRVATRFSRNPTVTCTSATPSRSA